MAMSEVLLLAHNSRPLWRRPIAILLAALVFVGGVAHAAPYPFAPMSPSEPWWAWPVPSTGGQRGPCFAWQPGSTSGSIHYRYDEAGHLIEIDGENSPFLQRLEWGPMGLTKLIHYDNRNNRQELVSEFERDAAGRIVAEHKFHRFGDSLVKRGTSRFRYDARGRLVLWTDDGWLNELRWEGDLPLVMQSTPPGAERPTTSKRYTWRDGRLATQTSFTGNLPLTWQYTYEGHRLVEIRASEGNAGGFDGKLEYDCNEPNPSTEH